MQKFNVSNYYRLGMMVVVHHRTFRAQENLMEVRVRALHDLKACFQLFLDGSVDTDWKATKECARKVLAVLEPRVGNSPGELLCMPFEAGYESRVYNAIATFEATFTSEAADCNIFAVSKKGTHSTLDLMERATDNFSPDIQARLTPEMKFDLCEAGRCLALDCHTASGYHILRAVERLIIKYVEKVTGKSYGLKNRNWGAYISVLKAHNADASVIGYLGHIKDFYRNPIIHPEDTLDHNEAFSLFHASLSAITQLDAAIEAIP